MSVLRLRRFDRSVGLVLAMFVALLFMENVAVGLGYRSQFVSTWEMASARNNLSPIALALSVPIAVSAVLIGKLAVGRRAWAVGILGLIGGAALAYGVSTGRQLASVAIRAPFVALFALLSGGLAWLLARELVRLRPPLLASLCAAFAVLAWLGDAFVLPRLYPALHLALFFATFLAWAGTALVFRRSSLAGGVAFLGILVAAGSIVWAPFAAKRVGNEDNLRRVLLEHAPILGRSVVIANKIAPPAKLDDDGTAAATLTSLRLRNDTRSIDWQGHDVILVTIDALRADHVSSYGYPRKTTPNIDALAARGARFEHAYCPTPHTSYSIASMMTGTYMKPLLALGSDDAAGETWPVQLRRYGYRTAAFYPPAVFFIDEHRFRRMRDENLGFEYKKEEFAEGDLRRAQVERYLTEAPKNKPLFLWVHIFDPHEPYEAHPEFPFEGDPRVDAYDSEVAAADALVGDVVRLVGEKRSPDAVFIVSADHGEEHGDHGGRYHGTTVYEEQVRVPLVVVGPGVAPEVVKLPVQTIDLLPTALAALDVPIPPRLRGRDLGPALAGKVQPNDEGLAFAETDDYTLVARGADRLVCARKIGSCTLFDVDRDPSEMHPIGDRSERVLELRKLTAVIERETGRVEASTLPDALRRGLQGDRDAAEDVAPLLDDARVDIRRLAARCAFKLQAPEMKVQLERSEVHDDDPEVRRWSTLALSRFSGGDKASSIPSARLETILGLLKKGEPDERYAAALVLGEHGDGRGEGELLARWTSTFGPGAKTPGEIDDARETMEALAGFRSRNAAPVLLRSLGDVRLRPYIVGTLAELGDLRAKEPLLRAFAEERYVHIRAPEARALLKLGVKDKLMPPLARFAGMPEPMTEAIAIARDARLLTADRAGFIVPPPAKGAPLPDQVGLKLRMNPPLVGPVRLLVLGGDSAPNGSLTGAINGVAIPETTAGEQRVFVVELGDVRLRDMTIKLSASGGIAAVWLVPHTAEIPPPPPVAWDAGVSDDVIPP